MNDVPEEMPDEGQAEALAAKVLEAMQGLDERERIILVERLLAPQPTSLNKLAERFKISRQRIHQLANNIADKVFEVTGVELDPRSAMLYPRAPRREFKPVVNAMSCEDIERIRVKVGLGRYQAGEVLGGGTRAFRKYEEGIVPPTASMISLLRLLDAAPALVAILYGQKLTKEEIKTVSAQLAEHQEKSQGG